MAVNFRRVGYAVLAAIGLGMVMPKASTWTRLYGEETHEVYRETDHSDSFYVVGAWTITDEQIDRCELVLGLAFVIAGSLGLWRIRVRQETKVR